MISSVAYSHIGPLPAIAWGGIAALLSFISAASIAIMNRRGIHIIPFVWHPRIAKIAIAIGLIHAFLAISVYFNF